MSPPITPAAADLLVQLGERLKAHRKQHKIAAATAAEAAGMSRVTLHRIERGEPSVTMGAWLGATAALGLRLELIDPQAPTSAQAPLPERIRLADYPQLKKLAWQLHGMEELTAQEALALYERNWRHVDRLSMSENEMALITALTRTLGGGRLLV